MDHYFHYLRDLITVCDFLLTHDSLTFSLMLISSFVIAFLEIDGSVPPLPCFPQLCLVIPLSFNFFAAYLAHRQCITAPGLSVNSTIFSSHKPSPASVMTGWPHTKVSHLVILAWLFIKKNVPHTVHWEKIIYCNELKQQ